MENIVGIIIALVVGYVIVYFLAHVFWLRTIITMVASGAALVTYLMGEWVVAAYCIFVAVLFLGGGMFGEETGEVEESYEVRETFTGDFRVTKRTHNPTFTFTLLIISAVVAVAYYYLLATNFPWACILLPLAIIGFKIFRIIRHIRYDEDEFD